MNIKSEYIKNFAFYDKGVTKELENNEWRLESECSYLMEIKSIRIIRLPSKFEINTSSIVYVSKTWSRIIIHFNETKMYILLVV